MYVLCLNLQSTIQTTPLSFFAPQRMEKTGTLECKTLISELTEGRELANQLKNYLHPAKSHEACGILVENILSSYENAFSLLNCMAMFGETSSVSAAILESPNSLAGTPTSEGSNPFSKDQNQRDVFKKRYVSRSKKK